VDERGFRAAMEQHRLASGGGKAMGKLGGEDAAFYAGILKELQRKGRLDDKGVQYDPYTSLRTEGEVLGLVVDGQAVKSASFGDAVEVILPRTGFYIESGGQVADEGILGRWPRSGARADRDPDRVDHPRRDRACRRDRGATCGGRLLREVDLPRRMTSCGITRRRT
jgi:alanyl-tRNA synthetase